MAITERVQLLMIDCLKRLLEGHSVLIVAMSEQECCERATAVVRAAKALGIRVRTRSGTDSEAPAVRTRPFGREPNGHANAFHGFIDPSCVQEYLSTRERAVRSVTA